MCVFLFSPRCGRSNQGTCRSRPRVNPSSTTHILEVEGVADIADNLGAGLVAEAGQSLGAGAAMAAVACTPPEGEVILVVEAAAIVHR